MIKNIIFDFGGVLIPLDESKTWAGLEALGASEELKDQKELFRKYETGKIETRDFLNEMKTHFFRKKIFAGDIATAWNAMLYTPLPGEVIDQLRKWRKKYRLFLLSNTNDLHISEIKKAAGPFDYKMFTSSFEKIYYSYEVNDRKPNASIFEKVLAENELKSEETFYIDDNKKNVKAAEKLGIKAWHLDPEENSILGLDKVLSKHHS